MKRAESVQPWMPLIEAGMELLLRGEDPLLDRLRKQYSSARIDWVETSGTGFFAKFGWAGPPEPLHPKLRPVELGNILIASPDLASGGGLVLHVDEGRLSQLEGYSFEGPWQDPLSAFSLEPAPSHETAMIKLLRFRMEVLDTERS